MARREYMRGCYEVRHSDPKQYVATDGSGTVINQERYDELKAEKRAGRGKPKAQPDNTAAFNEGQSRGYDIGYKAGHDAGYQAGFKAAKASTVDVIIAFLGEL